MLKGFNSIGNIQVYWRICETTYLQSSHAQHYHGLVEPLAELYSFIIEYQARIICHLSSAQLSRAWQDATGSNNWAGMVNSINNLDEACRSRFIPVGEQEEIRKNRDSQLQEMQRSRIAQEGILQTLTEARQDENERRLLHDLATAAGNYERYKDINPDRVPGTCEWFLTDERFCKWRDTESSSLLWVSAGPGRGKSVLTRSLIDEGLLTTTIITITPSTVSSSSTGLTICYFFFKDGGDGMDGAQALCAILHQLFKRPSTSGLIKHALPSHKNDGTNLTGKSHKLWRILVESASSASTDIVCILDALDECKEDSRKEIINELEKFYSQDDELLSQSKLKFLITSRPYDDMERSFQRFPTVAYLHFDGDDKSEQIGQEIDLVIDARMPDIARGFNRDDSERISEHLKSMENRTYLWLHLTFEIIQRKRSAFGRPSDIETLLSDLPSEVSDAYETILSRSQDDTRTEILLQMVLAAARPLTLDEANHVLALASQEARFSSYAELKQNLWPSHGFKSILQNLCGLFISVHDSKLFFIHQTAREFLIHPEQKGKWQGKFDMSKAHGTISGVCVRYLMLPDLATPAHDEPQSQQSFLSYAASNWPVHFRSQGADSADEYLKDARELCRVSEPQAQLWQPFLSHHYYWSWRENWTFWSDLACASVLGLAPVANDIITNEHVDGGVYGTALQLAIYQNHLKVVEVLLECHKVEITEQDIISAAKNGSEATTALLLDKRGNDIEITETVLVAAAENHSEATMALLLDKRSNEVKITEKVLMAAAENSFNREAIITLLLNKHGDGVKITETVLVAAAKNRSEATMALLLDKCGHEVKITKGVLEAAVRNYLHGEAIIILLLDKRGDEVKMVDGWEGILER